MAFPVVALRGAGHMPAAGGEARVFYMTAARATQRLLLGVNGFSASNVLLSG